MKKLSPEFNKKMKILGIATVLGLTMAFAKSSTLQGAVGKQFDKVENFVSDMLHAITEKTSPAP